MKSLLAYLCIISLWVGGVAWAQLLQIEDYSGDFWSRSGLISDWVGLRNTLTKRGINLGSTSCKASWASMPGNRSGVRTASATPTEGTRSLPPLQAQQC